MKKEYVKINYEEILKALTKNEYGQYIVDDLNTKARSYVWRHTDHPCSVENSLACLECPYTDCIAPHSIANFGNFEFRSYDGIAGKYESPYAIRLKKGGKRPRRGG